ncbi:MAG: CpsB/CapC family capsule biosynthesis tyrosine phosphatase, partial [Bacteroidales bacterium]
MFNIFKKKTQRNNLFYNTDIHSHIIPGIDDGSDSPETSLEIIKGLNELGINRMLATPHVTHTTYENTPEIISTAYDILMKSVQLANIDIDIQYSAEYRLDDYSLQQFNEGKTILLPNNHLLVESSFITEQLNLDSILFNLKILGHELIYAHPEMFC